MEWENEREKCRGEREMKGENGREIETDVREKKINGQTEKRYIEKGINREERARV